MQWKGDAGEGGESFGGGWKAGRAEGSREWSVGRRGEGAREVAAGFQKEPSEGAGRGRPPGFCRLVSKVGASTLDVWLACTGCSWVESRDACASGIRVECRGRCWAGEGRKHQAA